MPRRTVYSIVSLSTALAMIATSIPVRAEGRDELNSQAGLLARAIDREVRRVVEQDAAVALPGLGSVSLLKVASDWAAVRTLRTNAAIAVVVAGSGSRTRRFVSADDCELIVRNATSTERIAREDVSRVSVPRRYRGRDSAAAATAGAIIGGIFGVYSFVGLGFKDCYGSCSEERFLMGLSLVGLPILGGLLGYYSMSHQEWSVIYEAP